MNGQHFFFQFNRSTGRVLKLAPQFGTTIPVLSSSGTGFTGSANQAAALWKATVVP